ncbi:MAG TPA: FtsW/RodA/SpoVE family cell cycle protein, partial [Spirochaetia bacterium]|nr:FtsW/RodA/SpoVE family cell cycle protein [Spirochaetia bacterium]
MSERFQAEKIGRSQADYTMIALLVLLLGFGLSTLFSASYYYGARIFGSAEHFLYRQIVFVVVGLVIAYFLSRVSLDFIRKIV